MRVIVDPSMLQSILGNVRNAMLIAVLSGCARWDATKAITASKTTLRIHCHQSFGVRLMQASPSQNHGTLPEWDPLVHWEFDGLHDMTAECRFEHEKAERSLQHSELFKMGTVATKLVI